jgi:hypothetical protein
MSYQSDSNLLRSDATEWGSTRIGCSESNKKDDTLDAPGLVLLDCAPTQNDSSEAGRRIS